MLRAGARVEGWGLCYGLGPVLSNAGCRDGARLPLLLQTTKEDPDAAAQTSPAKGSSTKKPSRRNRGEGSLSSEDMLTHLGQAFIKAT